MRKFVIAVLLSGAAVSPALAQEWNDHGHHHNQQNGHDVQPQAQQPQQRGEGRGEGRNGGFYRQQAPQFVRQAPVQPQDGQRGTWGGERFSRGQFGGGQLEGHANVAPQAQVQVRQQGYGYRGYRGGFNGQVQQPGEVRSWNGQRPAWNRDGDYRQRVVQQSDGRNWNRDGDRWAGGTRWNPDWRSDRHYDWRRYRDSHRSVFRLGIYYDPFGYGYRPFDIGFRIAPVYFGQQYWIDPAMYELPYPPPGTQWIRYWNDAVLVDVYSGEVVDVIHDFFW